MFLPRYDSPFGARAHGFANLCFQAGKYYYCAAPVLVGWWIDFIAVRQRVRAIWPTIGLLLVTSMGAGARVQASQLRIQSGFGHTRLDFDWVPVSEFALRHSAAATILLFALFPYLLSRLPKI